MSDTKGFEFIRVFHEYLNFKKVEERLDIPEGYLRKSIKPNPKIKLKEEHLEKLDDFYDQVCKFIMQRGTPK